MTCCTLLENISTESPFTRILVFGWYDGLTSGLLQCGACGQTYFADLVTWDSEQVARIYVLKKVDRDKFERAIAAHGAMEPPRWPVWFPRYPDASTLETVGRTIDEAAHSGLLVDLVVATADIAVRIDRARRLSFDDWRVLLTTPSSDSTPSTSGLSR
jgi:hypothetical protein